MQPSAVSTEYTSLIKQHYKNDYINHYNLTSTTEYIQPWRPSSTAARLCPQAHPSPNNDKRQWGSDLHKSGEEY